MNHEIISDWTTEAGLRAVCLRTKMGHLCGYVAVDIDHPLHGKPWGDAVPGLAKALSIDDKTAIGKRGVIPLLCAAGVDDGMDRPDVAFDVHGGITYSGSGEDGYPIDDDGAGHLWWFGFDCAHAGDNPDTQNAAYVGEECESLARQLVTARAL